MAIIRKVHISNFRGIQSLEWMPSPGVNCLIGTGDSGKSSILDAIALCLGSRRTVAISDTDFYRLDVTQDISISITVGGLPDELKSLDTYGHFLRSINVVTGVIDDEPRQGYDTVLTIMFQVGADLEPSWALVSHRANLAGLNRDIAWRHRQLIAPAKIGGESGSQLSWARGSVLNRLTDEPANLGLELARAAREARALFGRETATQFQQALDAVTRISNELGISIEGQPRALLDAHSVSIGEGAVSLHSEHGIPLRTLGTGSARLLVCGIQKAVLNAAPIALLDEVEHGLEPHRLIRLLGAVGAKEAPPMRQVFMTTHSPVAIRELSAEQIFLVRRGEASHQVLSIGAHESVQGLIRAYPEAFLAKKIVVCEGATEVGFLRGIDQFFQQDGQPSVYARGVNFIDSNGGSPDRALEKGISLRRLGYEVCVFIDNDLPPSDERLQEYFHTGGQLFSWLPGQAIEDAIFQSLSDNGVEALIAHAVELSEEGRVQEHIRTKSNGEMTLESILEDAELVGFSKDVREVLGKAARVKNAGWFKAIGKMEPVAKTVIGPCLDSSAEEFGGVVRSIFGWAHA